MCGDTFKQEGKEAQCKVCKGLLKDKKDILHRIEKRRIRKSSKMSLEFNDSVRHLKAISK